MELIAVAAAVAIGLETRKSVLLASAVFAPLFVLVGMGYIYWRQGRVTESRAAMFCEAVASELRSGATLQRALVAAGSSVNTPGLEALPQGLPPLEAGRVVGEAFPEIGPELEFTVAAAVRGGSQAADLFAEIGSLAIAQAQVGHEVRVASAPARATALVFVGAPTLYLFFQVRSNRLAALFSQPEQRVVVLAGFALFTAGLMVAGWIAWRAR